ncbi:hypothetical protein HDV00_011269 [Rhizophlyctis rosea]|nr:hypothetical protein HDV00_011269 [Rhizophlyctis rosea]
MSFTHSFNQLSAWIKTHRALIAIITGTTVLTSVVGGYMGARSAKLEAEMALERDLAKIRGDSEMRKHQVKTE